MQELIPSADVGYLRGVAGVHKLGNLVSSHATFSHSIFEHFLYLKFAYVLCLCREMVRSWFVVVIVIDGAFGGCETHSICSCVRLLYFPPGYLLFGCC